MLSNSGEPNKRPRARLPNASWDGYIRNVGVYVGNRALCDGRGTVLADFRTRVEARQYRASEEPDDEFLLWKTTVYTGDGPDSIDEEWSRDELANLGALVGDGSFSKGPNVYVGERCTVDQCLCDGSLRVRSTCAFDWEGRLCGIVASREKRQEPSGGDSGPGTSSMARTKDGELPEVEPAAWRSPNVLLDYMLGEWNGRGILLNRLSGKVRQVSSKLCLRQSDSLLVHQVSGLSIDGGGRGSFVHLHFV